jgi:Beta-lactamase class C and other penicillin binding proteins
LENFICAKISQEANFIERYFSKGRHPAQTPSCRNVNSNVYRPELNKDATLYFQIMNRIINFRKLLHTGIILLICLTSCSRQIDENKFDHLFQDWNKTDEPGGAIGVIQNGELIYSKGFGIADLEHNIPITPKTVFYLASLSKQFTAFCILLLEEKGLLRLDDEIQKYLPDFPEYEAPITISQLIHHSSGLRDYSTLIDLRGGSYLEDISEKEVYELIKRQESLNFKPGDKYLYSNTGYFLLAKIVEVVTKETLKQFAQKNIFDPLGMTNTIFLDDNRTLIKNRAFSYNRTEGKLGFSNIIRRFDLVGSGGVYSTIEDMALWDKNFEHNKLGNGGQAIIEKMYQPEILNDGKRNNYAFGLENKTYRGIDRISHSGSHAGFRTFYIRVPEDNTSVILLSNRRDGDLNKVFMILDIMLEDKLQPTNPPTTPSGSKEEITKIDLTLEQLRLFVGNYYSKELKVYYSIFERENELMLRVNDGEETYLKKVDTETLSNEEFGNFSFVIKRDRVLGFNLSNDRVNNIYFSNVEN